MKQTDREAVLFANDAFYAAFAAGDMAAMRACGPKTRRSRASIRDGMR